MLDLMITAWVCSRLFKSSSPSVSFWSCFEYLSMCEFGSITLSKVLRWCKPTFFTRFALLRALSYWGAATCFFNPGLDYEYSLALCMAESFFYLISDSWARTSNSWAFLAIFFSTTISVTELLSTICLGLLGFRTTVAMPSWFYNCCYFGVGTLLSICESCYFLSKIEVSIS